MTTQANDELSIVLPRRAVRVVLAVVPLSLFLMSLPLEWARAHHGWTSHLTNLVRLSGEATIPTWWSSFLLLACGLALLAIARAPSSAKRRVDWTLLGGIFIYMSVDELVQIHELLNGFKPLAGFIYFGWVLPAAAIVLLLGVRFVPFLLSLPSRRRTQFIVAGCVYVFAALVIEIPLGMLAVSPGANSFEYRVLDSVEEALEIVGLSLFFVALLDALPRLTITVARDSRAAADR